MNLKNTDLYRDDGLGVFKALQQPDIQRKKKAINMIFE